MPRLKVCADWLFKDLRMRKGPYVIGEPANASIIIFTVSIILALLAPRGFWQIGFSALAYLALGYWSVREISSGHSRFRKLLGVMGLAAVIGALILHLGL